MFLWETAEGRLAAVLHPDGPGDAFLQIHPAFRSAELEVAMLSVAETQFATTQADGSQRLAALGARGGYAAAGSAGAGAATAGATDHRNTSAAARMDQPIPDVRPAEGYTFAPWVMRPNCPRGVGFRGEHFTPTSRTRNTRAGSGIATSSVRRSTVATSTWSPWRPTVNWRLSARSGSTT